jgi:hypothetical protein
MFTGIVSVNEIDASIGNFTGKVSITGGINVAAAVSGTSAVFTGVVSAATLDAENGDFSTKVSTNALNVNGVVSGTTAVFAGIVSVSALALNASNLGKRFAVSGAAIATIVSLTDAASIAVNFNTAQNFAVMLAGNRTLETPTNCVAGQTGSIFIMQNVSGGKTLSFGSNWKFAAGTAPTLTTTASAVDRLDYIVFSSTAVHTVATLDVR